MKFQKHLEWHIVPDWRDAYFSYKQLKKDLKRLKDEEEELLTLSPRSKVDVNTLDRLWGALIVEDHRSLKLKSMFETEASCVQWIYVHQRTLRTYTYEEIFYETELLGPFSDAEHVRSFFTKLDSQLNMINSFYKHKETEYVYYAQQLENQLHLLLERQSHPPDVQVSSTRAMKLLRSGFMEFYRSLGLLKSYSLLNRTAFGKILKKHDKVTGKCASETYLRAVFMSYFSTSDKILRMMEHVKSLFTNYFLKGNSKKALACLQPMRQRSTSISFVLGLFTGCSCSLIITFVLLLTLLHNERFPRLHIAFPIFSTLVLFLLHMYVYACDIYFWRRARINYSYIFEFNPRTNLKCQEVLLLSILCTLFLIACVLFYLIMYTRSGMLWQRFIPLGTLIVPASLLGCPFNVLYKPERFIFLTSLVRIAFAPLFKVVLADFFLADQLTSQVIALKNLGVTLCYYAGNYFRTDNGACASKFSLQYPLAVLPYWWRLMQCIRRWVDMRDPVQLTNAGKYLSALAAIVMKITYNWMRSSVWKGMFIASSVFATSYHLYWDLVEDWGLMQRRSRNPWLRDQLMVKNKWFYYFSIMINTVFRLLWLLSLFHLEFGVTKGMGVEFMLGALEVIRRGLWNFLRLENEHLNNAGNYRMIKVVPLPFEDTEILQNSLW